MTESEFEECCRGWFKNPDFLIGRQRKKDTTKQSEDHLIGAESTTQFADITDISELLSMATPDIPTKPVISAF